MVPDLSTLIEEAVVAPLAVSEPKFVDGAEKRANALGCAVNRIRRPDGRGGPIGGGGTLR